MVSVHPDTPLPWIEASRVGDVAVRWTAEQDKFESALYGTRIWSLRLELDDVSDDVLAGPRSAGLRSELAAELERLVENAAWHGSYVLSKVVRSEPLYDALVRHGFSLVGGRRLYRTRVRALGALYPPPRGDVSFACMVDLPVDRHSALRDEMLELADDVFREAGHGRHFVDPLLAARVPGVEYMKAVMRRNAERLGPEGFFLALGVDSGRLCGFSVIERRSADGPTYAQLLSAVHPSWRARGVYAGLSGLIAQRLPADAALLNITHSTNLSMQSVYERTRRVHLADTVEMRLAPEAPR